ncbi:MAG: hypothetical protein R3C61_17680 [Bacteroidia bacterium]
MKNLLIFFLALVLWMQVYPNAAQPGFWNAGGTGTFSLLYPEDSATYRKIQMVREKVSIQLYRGYAVVRGLYHMYNDTGETLNIRVGYPLNASYEGSSNYREEIRFDSLYSLRALTNGRMEEIIAQPFSGLENDNWYVWNTAFAPHDTTVVEVFFIVNTNETSISQGYSRDHNNGFIYLLETGATWKQPILQGEIRLRLMDGLTPDDIRGIAPGDAFMLHEDGKTLMYQFSDLSPTGENNIVIAYTPAIDNFDFGKVLLQQTALFDVVAAFSEELLPAGNFFLHSFGDPFEVSDSSGTYVGVLFLAIIYGIPLLAIFAVIFVGYLVFRRLRRNKKIS